MISGGKGRFTIAKTVVRFYMYFLWAITILGRQRCSRNQTKQSDIKVLYKNKMVSFIEMTGTTDLTTNTSCLTFSVSVMAATLFRSSSSARKTTPVVSSTRRMSANRA